MTRANTCHAIFILIIFYDITMSNDIRLMPPLRVDYIPKDGVICTRCKFKEICPEWYMCATYERTNEWDNVRQEE